MSAWIKMLSTGLVRIPDHVRKLMEKQGYKIILNHSAMKPCYWFRKALMEGRTCYKHRFYGIPSWRCLQMTPTASFCNLQCLYCWRLNVSDVPAEFRWKEVPEEGEKWDDPEEIADESIRLQRMIVQGYKGVKVFRKEWVYEAEEPKHAAISLTGEPTLYPHIGGLVEAYAKRGMTTFIVTNGTLPERLEKLEREPTQLYVTVPAPNERLYMEITRPLWPDAWSRLQKTLEMLQSFSSPTVMRIPLIKGFNMDDKVIEEFSRLIKESQPTYVEPKAYMWVGYSRRRLGRENMPTHEEVRAFASKIAELAGYNIIDESPESRIVLLSRLERAIRFY
ncbi:MAG: 4-demethylwyosine synthase TYW1 [Candidatus Korarchaeota archaeon]|nr:4-demethylwyosine synthase TYW1 [Candidatus Korarchaeota archaeon]